MQTEKNIYKDVERDNTEQIEINIQERGKHYWLIITKYANELHNCKIKMLKITKAQALETSIHLGVEIDKLTEDHNPNQTEIQF